MNTLTTPPLPSGTVLLFDLGGVLVDATGINALKAWFPDLTAMEIRRRWHASNAVTCFECGEISPDEFAARFLLEWRIPLSPNAFLEEFSRWVNGFYPGAIELLARLKTRYTVAYLSNTNEVHWGRLEREMGVFHHCFPSHQTGRMKPDPAAYAKVIHHLGTDAENIIFFDDLETNLDAARQVGMQALLTVGLSDVEIALRSLGVNIHHPDGRRSN